MKEYFLCLGAAWSAVILMVFAVVAVKTGSWFVGAASIWGVYCSTVTAIERFRK